MFVDDWDYVQTVSGDDDADADGPDARLTADLHRVLRGVGTLDELHASAARVQQAMRAALGAKTRVVVRARVRPRPPAAEEVATAEAVAARLRALAHDIDTRMDALRSRATPLRVADVKRVLDGATLFVIRAQEYETVDQLTNTDEMFEDAVEPLGYFQGEYDTDITGVGGGSDVWYIADRGTLQALGGIRRPRKARSSKAKRAVAVIDDEQRARDAAMAAA